MISYLALLLRERLTELEYEELVNSLNWYTYKHAVLR